MFHTVKRKLTLRQKHLIKYACALFSVSHITSLLPNLRHTNHWAKVINQVWSLLQPVQVDCGLKRVGGLKDGGYLIPDTRHNFDGLISPGVGDSFSFEVDFTGPKMSAVLIDATVPKPKGLPANMIYLEKLLGSGLGNRDVFITIQEVKRRYFADSKSLALQMDIEGAEYEILGSMRSEDLSGIDLILVEFHNLHKMIGLESSENLLIKSLEFLLGDFDLVHTHPNNAGGFYLNKFRVFPKVVETTWVRKGLVEIQGHGAKLPHPLDAPNDSLIWDLALPRC